MNRGPGPGEFASEDPNFDLALRRLLTGETTAEPEAASSFGEVLPPAVAILRARDMTEPIIGKRCRYLLTDHDEQGNIIDYGWRSDLRVVSEREEVDFAPEPCYWVQEEADYYQGLAGERYAPRFALGASRLWVETYVDQQLDPEAGPACQGSPSDRENPNAWLGRVVVNPNLPKLVQPIPARRAHSLVGRRAIIVRGWGQYETEMRAVDDPTFAQGGDIGITLTSERDWYLWKEPPTGVPSPKFMTVPIEQAWIEA